MSSQIQQAGDVVFALVAIDKELWNGWITFQRNQRIKKWKAPTVFQWQHGGITYECGPDEAVQVPFAAAKQGVKKSGVFRLDTDESGHELMILDHDSDPAPMLTIERTMAANEPQMIRPVPETASLTCPFMCKDLEFVDQEALRIHIVREHNLGNAEASGSKAGRAMETARKKTAA